jgi:unsaturated rhamnogalacturonyl hydrolase
VPAAQAGNETIKFRFANANNGKKNRATFELRVNGVLVSTLTFGSTGSASTWQMLATDVSLYAGNNSIRLTSTSANPGPNIDRLDADDHLPTLTDWTKILVESTMARLRTPASLGGWAYYTALFLRGVLTLHQRTGDARYFDYVKAWVDAHVSSSGVIDVPLDKLDNFMPGHLLLSLHQATGQAKYKIAADSIRARFNTYPRLSDGGLWHKEITPWQIWIDGVFMANPFLMRYGLLYGDSAYANDEATHQILVDASHLVDPATGLLYHAFDESGQASWANPVTHRSPEFWCRSLGWYGMTIIDVLDLLPADHANRAALISTLQNLIAGLVRYQDPATGRWFQVVDKASVNGNWLETSCGSMHTYMISKAIEKGYVDGSYVPAMQKGLAGTLAKISLGSDGLTNLTNICVGTAVGDLSYYLNRPQATNDMHGLGAFIIMFEQLNK